MYLDRLATPWGGRMWTLLMGLATTMTMTLVSSCVPRLDVPDADVVAADAAAADAAAADAAPADAAIADAAADAAPSDAGVIVGPADGTVTITYGTVRQTIEGFGGSNAWTALPANAAARATVVALLFSASEGIGLSILRTRIPFREQPGNGSTIPDYDDDFIVHSTGDNYQFTTNPDGSKTFELDWGNWDLDNTRALIDAVQALGADGTLTTIMSTPWTPPNNATTNWKQDVPNVTDYPQVGGSLKAAFYDDYADLLADYVNGFEANMGMPLDVISIQNEPTYIAAYESCYWTAQNIHDFLAVLKEEFVKKDVPDTIRVMAAEDENFEEDLVSPTLLDASTASVVDLVGVHQYDQSETNFAAKWLPTVKDHGKDLWVTEISQGSANDGSITDGLYWARMIHTDLTLAEVNAFNYWWLWTNATNATKSSLINVTGTVVADNKRLYTLGQYSRYIRPGWSRVSSTTSPATGVYASAYRDPAASQIAIVLINSSNAAVEIDLQLDGAAYGAVATSRTSATESLTDVDALLVDGALARATLPAHSVTTVHGAIQP